jgi:hypothetical protein
MEITKGVIVVSGLGTRRADDRLDAGQVAIAANIHAKISA